MKNKELCKCGRTEKRHDLYNNPCKKFMPQIKQLISSGKIFGKDKKFTPQTPRGCGKYLEKDDRTCGDNYGYYQNEKRSYIKKSRDYDIWLCPKCTPQKVYRMSKELKERRGIVKRNLEELKKDKLIDCNEYQGTDFEVLMCKILTPNTPQRRWEDKEQLAQEEAAKNCAYKLESRIKPAETSDSEVPITDFNKDMSYEDRQYYGEKFDENR